MYHTLIHQLNTTEKQKFCFWDCPSSVIHIIDFTKSINRVQVIDRSVSWLVGHSFQHQVWSVKTYTRKHMLWTRNTLLHHHHPPPAGHDWHKVSNQKAQIPSLRPGKTHAFHVPAIRTERSPQKWKMGKKCTELEIKWRKKQSLKNKLVKWMQFLSDAIFPPPERALVLDASPVRYVRTAWKWANSSEMVQRIICSLTSKWSATVSIALRYSLWSKRTAFTGSSPGWSIQRFTEFLDSKAVKIVHKQTFVRVSSLARYWTLCGYYEHCRIISNGFKAVGSCILT